MAQLGSQGDAEDEALLELIRSALTTMAREEETAWAQLDSAAEAGANELVAAVTDTHSAIDDAFDEAAGELQLQLHGLGTRAAETVGADPTLLRCQLGTALLAGCVPGCAPGRVPGRIPSRVTGGVIARLVWLGVVRHHAMCSGRGGRAGRASRAAVTPLWAA